MKNQKRNEKSCAHRGRVIRVEVIVEPVVVPVPLATIPVEIADIEVAIGVANCMKCHLCHCSLNTLRAESYS